LVSEQSFFQLIGAFLDHQEMGLSP
jgi:hypothetical protein